VPRSASIIDVGGGASTLVDDLLDMGYSSLSVLDISSSALAVARKRIGERSDRVNWIEADITRADLPVHGYDVWHDRAVFHFLTAPDARKAYVEQVFKAVKPNGHIIIATFAEDGPTQCSGLPVMRYTADELHDAFGPAFELIHHEKEEHLTPFETVQKFVYCYCRKRFS
jgi:2-polyprenyl-3-methyl-5-hydroxy-6-metoxy-1,4-benzoquinol methylase